MIIDFFFGGLEYSICLFCIADFQRCFAGNSFSKQVKSPALAELGGNLQAVVLVSLGVVAAEHPGKIDMRRQLLRRIKIAEQLGTVFISIGSGLVKLYLFSVLCEGQSGF